MEAAFALILESGVVGAFCVIFALTTAYLYKAREKAMSDHITDLKAIHVLVETVKVQLVATEQALRSAVDYIKGGSK